MVRIAALVANVASVNSRGRQVRADPANLTTAARY